MPVFILVALLLLGWGGYSLWRWMSEVNEQPAQAAIAPTVTPPPTKVPQVRKQPLTVKALQNQPIAREEIQAAPEEPEEALPPIECTSQTERIAGTALDQLILDFNSGAFELDPTCEQFELQSEQVSAFYAACRYIPEQHKIASEAECSQALAMYRMNKIDQVTADRTDYRAMSLPLLMNKIMARFQSSKPGTDAWDQNVEMIQVLIEREPQFFAARKALVASLMPQMKDSDIIDQVATATQNARRLNPQDYELQEIELLVSQLGGQPEAADAFVASNPQSPLGYYYRASNLLKSGNREAAIADLEQAIALAPQDQRYKSTLQKLLSNEPGVNHFEVKVGFSFDNL